MRRLFALVLAALIVFAPAAACAVPAAWTTVGFQPQTDLYATSGTHVETVPIGPLHVTIEGWGSGGGGGGATVSANGGGGSSGSYSKIVLSLTSSDWGKTFTCTNGVAGAGSVSTTTNGSAGATTSVANTTDGQTVSLSDPGGNYGFAAINGGAGGAAPSNGTGGSTNTAGNAGTSGQPGLGGSGIVGVNGTGYGAGGASGVVSAGNSGGSGACSFTYSWAWPFPNRELA